MTNQVALVGKASSTKQSAWRFGVWISVLTALAAAASLGIAIFTPPRSGPFCNVNSCIQYPYTNAAAFVPNDYLWMYPAILMVLLFTTLVACIHHHAALAKKLYSQIALAIAVISATVLSTDYFIQLSVIQPSLLKGEVEGLSLFSQYNPHGVFIALEDAGYLMMSIAFLFIALVFERRTRIERVIQWLFITGFGLTVGSLVVLVLIYGMNLEYRFEVASILFTWLALIVCCILLSIFFGQAATE